MDKILSLLFVTFLSSHFLFAQFNRAAIHASIMQIDISEDTMQIKKDTFQINDNVIDSTFHRLMLHCDSAYFYQRDIYKSNVFKPKKYDAFKERIKEPWLGDILKNIFFK